MGQILSEEGDQEEAINCLIDALRWDSKNGYALLMMGNIQAKFLEDIPTAMKYYDQAVLANQADHIALTNIAYLLFKSQNWEAAKKYAYEAKKLDANYPNTSFILALIAKHENDLHSAFYSMIQVLKTAQRDDELSQNALKQAFEIANDILNADNGKSIFYAYRSELEKQGGVEIDIFSDDEITTAAKIEFAERYHRDKHLVKYKSAYPAVAHLVMHELTHLDFVLQARKANRNKVFLANSSNRANFQTLITATVQQLKSTGIPNDAIQKFADGLFNGLNLQQYNTPIDLFIEEKLFHEYPALRPYQFLSLHSLLQEAIQSVTNGRILELIPSPLISKTRTLSLLNALQFETLFGVNLIPNLKATSKELELAKTFYSDFTALKNKRTGGQEFDLITAWSKQLQTAAYFELEDEENSSSENDIDAFLRKIEQDPYGLNEEEDPDEKAEMEQFQKHQESIGTNPAIILFISEALQYFKNKTQAEIKATAFEIAQLGMTGIDPNKKDYIIGSMKGKRFSGNQVLAMMYTAWKLALPEQVGSLGLPFEKEFEMALQLQKN